MKFSIVIPVYKVEEYLYECVESVLNQTYKDIEIILVDDGSPDKCPQMCDEFAKRDFRIKVIHQANSGLSSARNAGIRESTGDYLVFVDSDDIITNSAIEYFSEKMVEFPDVLITEYFNSPDVSQINLPSSLFSIPDEINKESVIRNVFYKKKNTWASVQYIVKRKLITENDLKFDVGYYHEDVSWTGRLFAFANTFEYYNRPWYIRRIGREGSITSTINPKRTFDMLSLVSQQIESSIYDVLSEYEKRLMFNQFVRAAFSSLVNYKKYEKQDREKVCRLIKEHISDYQWVIALRHKMFYVALKVLGVKNALNLIF